MTRAPLVCIARECRRSSPAHRRPCGPAHIHMPWTAAAKAELNSVAMDLKERDDEMMDPHAARQERLRDEYGDQPDQ